MYENIAIYAHGSTESSIDNQVSHVKDYLRQKGYSDSNFEIFIDEGYSGLNVNRSELQRLLVRLEKFDAIAVWRPDRITRDNKQLLHLVNNYLSPLGIKVLVSAERFNNLQHQSEQILKLFGGIKNRKKYLFNERRSKYD